MCLNSQDQRSKNPITDVQSDVENDLSKNKNRITHLRVYRNNILDRIDICKKNVEFLPNDLNEIKKCAYCGYKKLRSAEIPCCTQILEGAFKDCKGLENVSFVPVKNVCEITIGKDAFAGCTSLKEIQLPENLMGIDDGAFFECIQLEKITIPKNVEYIGDNAFSGCLKLKVVRFLGATEFNYHTFENCENLKVVFVPFENLVRYNEMFAVQSKCNPDVVKNPNK